jgi:hypothetical protein
VTVPGRTDTDLINAIEAIPGAIAGVSTWLADAWPFGRILYADRIAHSAVRHGCSAFESSGDAEEDRTLLRRMQGLEGASITSSDHLADRMTSGAASPA